MYAKENIVMWGLVPSVVPDFRTGGLGTYPPWIREDN